MLTSKLPAVGMTIFSQMSSLSAQHDAINLSQGFPNFDCDPYLKQQVNYYINNGFNQYCPMAGLPDLQQAIQTLVREHYELNINAAEQVTVTSGATEALFVAIQTIVHAGDEVIIFDPAYDSYEPAVNLAGGKCIHIPLLPPSYGVDWQQVEQAITSQTKAIIINSPHNPTGTILHEQDIIALKKLVAEHDLYVISDEVYEHIVFDGQVHHSILRYPELAQRSFVIASFGKTFHVTGWKVGYCIAPKDLTDEFRKIHQYVTFCTVTPMQKAIADTLNKLPEHVSGLSDFYQHKRAVFAEHLKDSQFKLLPSEGTYFQLLDYSALSDLPDVEFCHWLTKVHKVATIPLSVFYQSPPKSKVIRVCFAKDDETLKKAAKILCQV
ncbi:MAG: methionine aminotransferase [Alteromonadaceae bacterium]|jgi:methionine aminotransferase